MKILNRIISLFMVALMLVSAVPFTIVGAADDVSENYIFESETVSVESSFDAGNALTGVSFFNCAEFEGCYGNQLSGTAKEIYDSLVKNYAEDKITGEYTHSFDTPFTFDAEIAGDTIVTNDELEAIQLELQYAVQAAMDAFLYDHPEVFWLKKISTSYGISASGNSLDGYTGIIEKITIISEEVYDGASAEISLYDAAVESALDSITVTESRYETLKNIHDYICNIAWYNLVDEQSVHSSAPFFIGDGGVVCEGYAKSFKVLCDRLGILCVLVSGYAGENHMWNYVQMDDGKWYLVDATWDDQKSKIYDTYFLADTNTVGFNNVLISAERTERNDFSGTGVFSFTYPVLSETAYVTHTHEWDADFTVDTEPTCSEKGSKSIHCKKCEEVKDITEIPEKDHSHVSVTVKPTCTEKGYTSHVCSACGESHTDTYVDAINHTYTSKITVSATCTNQGVKTYTCVCGDSYTKPIEKLNHKYTNACDKDCNTCNAKRTTKHTYTNACDTSCNVCGVKRSVTHSYKTVKTTMATLSKNGKVTEKCKYCGHTKSTTVYYPKSIRLSATSYTYNGKNRTPSVTVKDSKGRTLKKNTDYTVKCSKSTKAIGKYTVTVTFKGKYSGSKKLTFEIVPAKVNLSKLTAGKKQLITSWKTVSGASGYELQYSTSAKFTSKTTKKITVKSSKTKKSTIKKLTKGKKYFVRIRAYKTVNKKPVYGAWSSVKSIRAK